MGRWKDKPVGPHPTPMYQIAFSNDEFPKLVPWLMLNHEGLSILIQPNTDDIIANHLEFSLWLGTRLDLNITFLETGITKV